MNTSRDSIEEMGWQGIDTLMDLMEDNLIKFAGQTNIMPNEMRKYIEKELDTIIEKAWTVKIRRAYVHMREMSQDVRLP